MTIKRLIPIQCLQLDNEFIPFWRLTFVKDKDNYCGDGYYIDDEKYKLYYQTLVDCYWDTKTKKVLLGQIKDIYPDTKKLHEKGKTVYYEIHNAFRESIITDILYEEYDVRITKFKDLNKWELKAYFTDDEVKNFNSTDIFEFRQWKPYYLLDNGFVSKWSFEIKEKYVEVAE